MTSDSQDLRTTFLNWAFDDVLSNTTRGLVAEFHVARALGVTTPRVQWDAYDLETPNGIRVEVKSAAYLQSWPQSKPSTISFDIAPKRSWHAATNTYDDAPSRSADVYVFCLLDHRDRDSVDVFDVDQWRFWVLATRILDERLPAQKSVAPSTLERVGARLVPVGQLATEIASQVGP